MKLTPTISTPSIATSNRAEVHRTSTNPIMRALKGLSNTFQKWVGSSGQKGHSSQPADKQSINKMEIIGVGVRTQNAPNKTEIKRPNVSPPPPPTRNSSSATSVSSLTVAKKTQVTRPTSPPPPPPIQNPSSATSASSLTVAKKTQVTRPSSPPPPPPPAPPVLDKTNTSQQGPEISAKKESKPVPPSAKDTREMLNNLLHEKPDIYKKLMFALGNRANDQQKNKDSDH